MAAANGYSIVELLATLALVGILALAAVPTLAGWLLDLRRDAAVSTALHAVQVARQIAAVRGEDVRLCGSHDERRCSGLGNWTGNLLVASDDSPARRSLPTGADTRLRSNRAVIQFEAGTGHATPATLVICDRRGAGAARTVVVSRSGRPRATGPGEAVVAC